MVFAAILLLAIFCFIAGFVQGCKAADEFLEDEGF